MGDFRTTQFPPQWQRNQNSTLTANKRGKCKWSTPHKRPVEQAGKTVNNSGNLAQTAGQVFLKMLPETASGHSSVCEPEHAFVAVVLGMRTHSITYQTKLDLCITTRSSC